jgi:hypothetical protein
MTPQIRVGVACPIPAERATLLEWLRGAHYEPVPMLDVNSVVSSLEARPIEVLIADAGAMTADEIQFVMRLLGPNRPLILIGEPGTPSSKIPRDASWLDRGVSQESLLLSVALSLAEGRPARRSPRKPVSHLIGSIDGVMSQVLDVSSEGVRLELAGASSATALPPIFTMRVPAFGVVTTVKRIWVAQPGRRALWCGGTVERTSPKAAMAWKTLVDTAPTSGVIYNDAGTYQ